MTGFRRQRVDEASALRSFCKKRIQNIKQQQDLPEREEKHLKTKSPSITTAEPVIDQSVPVQLLWTLKLKTFREEMRKGAEQDFHQPSHCPACLDKQADLAMKFFIRKHTRQLQSRLLEEKIQSHLYNKDSICLLGEILRDLPKPSDDPAEIWQKLLSSGGEDVK